jgi:hypothetical protein
MLTALVEANMSSGPLLKIHEVDGRPRSSSRQRTPVQDHEGMIPVHTQDSEQVYYIVDCPSLDLVEATLLFPDGYIRGSIVSHNRFHSLKYIVTLLHRSLSSSRLIRSQHVQHAQER